MILEASIIPAIVSSGSRWQKRLVGWKLGKKLHTATRDHQMAHPKLKLATQLRAALYARFSNDVQNERSIDRQFADLEKAAQRLGFKLDKRHYYCDRAQSGTSLFERPGLTRELLGAAAKNEFDVVLVEQTDRLSREQADTHWLAARFKFYNTKIFTPAGEVSALQLTFEGYQNADFITKLAGRVKSGHNEIARAGKIAGKKPYGYDGVLGKPGECVINEKQAAVVRRMFTEYASGKSPRQIVQGFIDEGIPSPSGAHWNYQGIVGGSETGRGLIHNRLYIGELVRNRFTNVKNPDTGRRIVRKSAQDDLIVVPVPHLRIIGQELWEAAHAVRLARQVQMAGPGGYKPRPVLPRKSYLLSGLLRCGTCNGQMTIISSALGGRVGCSSAAYRRTCNHTKTYHLGTVTNEVIGKMHEQLTNHEFLKARMKAKAAELAKAEKEGNVERVEAQRKLDRLNLQIARLVSAIENTDAPVKELMDSIKAKEIERVGLQERIRLLGAETNVTVLQPTAMSAFGKSIETLAGLLRRNENDPACRLALSNIIDCVIVHPTPKKRPYELSMYARLSAIRGIELFPERRSHQQIVAAEGLSRITVEAEPR